MWLEENGSDGPVTISGFPVPVCPRGSEREWRGQAHLTEGETEARAGQWCDHVRAVMPPRSTATVRSPGCTMGVHHGQPGPRLGTWCFGVTQTRFKPQIFPLPTVWATLSPSVNQEEAHPLEGCKKNGIGGHVREARRHLAHSRCSVRENPKAQNCWACFRPLPPGVKTVFWVRAQPAAIARKRQGAVTPCPGCFSWECALLN
jgi:hypothetical protein